MIVGPRHAVVVVVIVRVETLVGLRSIEVLPHLGSPLVVLGVPTDLGILVDVRREQARSRCGRARARLVFVVCRYASPNMASNAVETSLFTTVFRAGGPPAHNAQRLAVNAAPSRPTPGTSITSTGGGHPAYSAATDRTPRRRRVQQQLRRCHRRPPRPRKAAVVVFTPAAACLTVSARSANGRSLTARRGGQVPHRDIAVTAELHQRRQQHPSSVAPRMAARPGASILRCDGLLRNGNSRSTAALVHHRPPP